jgi:hypothetical protein
MDATGLGLTSLQITGDDDKFWREVDKQMSFETFQTLLYPGRELNGDKKNALQRVIVPIKTLFSKNMGLQDGATMTQTMNRIRELELAILALSSAMKGDTKELLQSSSNRNSTGFFSQNVAPLLKRSYSRMLDLYHEWWLKTPRVVIEVTNNSTAYVAPEVSEAATVAVETRPEPTDHGLTRVMADFRQIVFHSENVHRETKGNPEFHREAEDEFNPQWKQSWPSIGREYVPGILMTAAASIVLGVVHNYSRTVNAFNRYSKGTKPTNLVAAFFSSFSVAADTAISDDSFVVYRLAKFLAGGMFDIARYYTLYVATAPEDQDPYTMLAATTFSVFYWNAHLRHIEPSISDAIREDAKGLVRFADDSKLKDFGTFKSVVGSNVLMLATLVMPVVGTNAFPVVGVAATLAAGTLGMRELGVRIPSAGALLRAITPDLSTTSAGITSALALTSMAAHNHGWYEYVVTKSGTRVPLEEYNYKTPFPDYEMFFRAAALASVLGYQLADAYVVYERENKFRVVANSLESGKGKYSMRGAQKLLLMIYAKMQFFAKRTDAAEGEGGTIFEGEEVPSEYRWLFAKSTSTTTAESTFSVSDFQDLSEMAWLVA